LDPYVLYYFIVDNGDHGAFPVPNPAHSRCRLNEKNRSSGEDHRDEMLAAVESLTEKDEEEEQEKKVDKAPLAKVRKEGEKHWDESFWT
jgi:hypothetical protein